MPVYLDRYYYIIWLIINKSITYYIKMDMGNHNKCEEPTLDMNE